MRRRAVLGRALIALAALVPPRIAEAQLYRWVNEGGEVHFTQGLENIPERFRAGARLLGYPEATPAPPVPAVSPAPASAEPARTPPAAVRGGARIPYTPGSPILVPVRVNGLRTLRLVLDTGAESTLIHPRALAALGVDAEQGRSVTVTGVTGVAEGRSIRLESLEVGEARVEPFTVVAYDLLLREGDGLLGRDFLDRFRVNIDADARLVILSPR